MKIKLLLFALLFTTIGFSQDIVGTWVSYDIIPFKSKKEIVTDSIKGKFYSALSFKEDSTFTLITAGYEVVMGKFSIRNGMVTLFKLDGFEEYQRYWDIMWPANGDPHPETEVVDFLMATQCEVKHKKKGTAYVSDVYALYQRSVAESEEEVTD